MEALNIWRILDQEKFRDILLKIIPQCPPQCPSHCPPLFFPQSLRQSLPQSFLWTLQEPSPSPRPQKQRKSHKLLHSLRGPSVIWMGIWGEFSKDSMEIILDFKVKRAKARNFVIYDLFFFYFSLEITKYRKLSNKIYLILCEFSYNNEKPVLLNIKFVLISIFQIKIKTLDKKW